VKGMGYLHAIAGISSGGVLRSKNRFLEWRISEPLKSPWSSPSRLKHPDGQVGRSIKGKRSRLPRRTIRSNEYCTLSLNSAPTLQHQPVFINPMNHDSVRDESKLTRASVSSVVHHLGRPGTCRPLRQESPPSGFVQECSVTTFAHPEHLH